MGERFEHYGSILDELHVLLREMEELKDSRQEGSPRNEAVEVRLARVEAQIRDLKQQLGQLIQSQQEIEELVIEAEGKRPEEISDAIARILEVSDAHMADFSLSADLPIDHSVDALLREQLRRRDGDVETTVGTLWFRRAGILIALAGAGLLVYHLLPLAPPEMRLGMGALITAGLYLLGGKLSGAMPVIGRMFQCLGVGAGYFSLYAAFFFTGFQLWEAPFMGISLLFAYSLGALAVSHVFRTQNTAIFASFLAYFTACYPGLDTYGLLIAVITLTAGLFLSFQNPGWRILPKANALAILVLFLFWHYVPGLTGSNRGYLSASEEAPFLWGVFLLTSFFVLYPKRRADPTLNMLNTLGFYLVYRLTQPVMHPEGLLEFLMVSFQIISSYAYSRLRRNLSIAALTDSCTVLALLFFAVATLRFFEGKILAMMLSLWAMGFGMYSRHLGYRWTFHISAILYYALALVMFLPFQFTDALWLHLTTALIVSLNGLLIEHCVLTRWKPWQRSGFLLAIQAAYGASLYYSLPDVWLSIAFFLSGLAFLCTGILHRLRKYRLIGISWVLIACLNVIINDLALAGRLYQVVTFLAMGVGLVAISHWYGRFARNFADD